MAERSREDSESSSEPTDHLRLSHLSLSETVAFAMQLRVKVESEWQRVVNVHAALIGVMIFFAGQDDAYVAARIVVFAFYTFNVIVSWANFNEDYTGLAQVHRDLMLFPRPAVGGHGLDWLRSRTFRHDARLRSSLLATVWLIIGYLMIVPLIVGRLSP